ncbi:MAG: PD40 domain-containing protein [Ardenticatenaceae bacterium]|nr:PD40 domain-containing protein [Ardenticatenaceae bacterium]
MRVKIWVLLILAVFLMAVGSGSREWLAEAQTTAVSTTTRLSVSSSGTEANAASTESAVSADGRFVAFTSSATNLVSGVSGFQVYLRDRDSDADNVFDEPGGVSTTLISMNDAGNAANITAAAPAISADGRYVAFASSATNLHPNATDTADDIFVRDRQTGTTMHVSKSSAGVDANQQCGSPAISADGRYVVFHSWADNLTPLDTNGWPDVFLHDRDVDNDGIFDEPGQVLTRRISVGMGSTNTDHRSDSPVISADGSTIVFASMASNLVPGDTASSWDVFISDISGSNIQRISVSTSGGQADGASGNAVAYKIGVSSNGRFITFESAATNLVSPATDGLNNIFRYDRDSDGNGIFDEPGGTAMRRVSVPFSGTQINDHAFYPSISGDGRYIAYQSAASNIVNLPNNFTADVYVYDATTGTTRLASVASEGWQGNFDSIQPALDGSGQQAFFTSRATNFVGLIGDTNDVYDVFVNTAENFDPPPLVNWQRQLIETRGSAGQFSDLVLDANNHPHVAYVRDEGFGSDLLYAHWDGVTWQKELVDKDILVGNDVSLLLDAQQRPHIVYQDSHNQDLHYAYFDGTAWQKALLVQTGTVGRFNNIALTSAGLAVTYLDETQGGIYILFGAVDGLTFGQPRRVATTSTLAQHGLAVNSSGLPRVSYHDSVNGDLRLATYLTNTTWTTELVADFANIGVTSSLAYDSSDQPHIAATTFYEGRYILSYHTRSNGSWVEETVAADVNKSLGRFHALALEGNGRPAIAYVNNTDSTLLLARRVSADNWQTETIDSNHVIRLGGLALTSDDTPFVSYYEQRYADLIVSGGGPDWQTRLVYNNLAQPNHFPALALNGHTPAVGFHTESSQPLSIQFTPWNGAAWPAQIVELGADQTIMAPLVYDGNGQPYVAYYHAASREVRLTTLTSNIWVEETAVTLPAGMTIGPDLVLLLVGQEAYPTLAFSTYSAAEGARLVMAQKFAGGWDSTATAVPNHTAPISPLAADYRYGGSIGIVYANSVTNSVHEASYDNGWLDTQLASGVSATSVATAVSRRRLDDGTPANTPTVAYYDATANQIVYLEKDAETQTWAAHPVGTPAAPVESLALALLNNAATRPRLAVITTDNGVRLFSADGDSFNWTEESVVAAGTAVLAQVNLAFGDRERITYLEDGAVWHAFRTATTLAPVVPAESDGIAGGLHPSFCVCFLLQQWCAEQNALGRPSGSEVAIRPAQATAVTGAINNDGPVFGALTQLFLATPEGSAFVDTYFVHDYELVAILFNDPLLTHDAFRTLENLTPGLTAFTQRQGSQVIIDQALMDQALDIWQRVAAVASPELAGVINQYLADTNNLQDYVGLTFDEWAATLGVNPPDPLKVYLPLVQR